MIRVVVLCVLIVCLEFAVGQVTHTYTFAGIGVGGYNGDGALATSSMLSKPTCVAVNSLGEVLIADTNNNRIRKILLNGTMMTIAGNGVGGYNGDGALATSSMLSKPTCVAVNSLGEVLIADTSNNRIRKILMNGTMMTIAGNGVGGYNGDGALATSSLLSKPTCVAVNSLGEVLIADTNNHRIRKILLNGTMMTIAGNGVGGYNGDGTLATSSNLNSPLGVAVNSLGEVLIADTNNNRIRKILLNGKMMTIAGNGVGGYNGDGALATSLRLSNPTGVAVNSSGEVLIADTSNNRIRNILADGTMMTIAGNGVGGYNGDGTWATSLWLANPTCVAVNSLGEVLIADSVNNRLRKITCPTNSVLSDNICYCNVGYFGQFCGQFKCSNILTTSSSVCSSHGQCIGPDQCTCNSGYSGTNCEAYECYGVPFNKSSVCSGLGKCIGYNQCLCKNEYFGSTCANFACSSIPFSDVRVCSSNGDCIAPNNCSCRPDYFGSTCELFNCFGVLKDKKTTCSGVGTCFSPDQCECPTSQSTSTHNKDCSLRQNSTDIVQSTLDQTTILIAAIVPSVFVFLIVTVVLIIIIIVLVVRSKRTKTSSGDADPITINNNPSTYEMRSFAHSNLISDFPSQYSSSSLSQATDPMDRYIDLVKIGQGGFGSVFRARDTKSGNETKAIKVIKFDNNDDLNMAMREGIQLLKMNHPNVLKVNDFFIGNGQILCIDMVYYEKGDLSILIGSSSFCSEMLVSQILLQSCSALDYIYKNFGVIHRDIKPSNIFIKKIDNSNIEIVIADFGLAKNTKQSTSVSFAGTPMYISPELLCGVNGDHKTDIFSLGVTLFQIISHDTTTSINQLYILKGADTAIPILKGKINQQYSPQFIELVLSMLDKDPEQRPDASSIIQHNYFKC